MKTANSIIYTALLETGYTVYKKRPEVLRSFPCITYNLLSGEPTNFLSGDIAKQVNTYAVDIYAQTGEEASSILEEVQEVLLENEFFADFVADIDDDEVVHLSARFKFLV